MALSGKQLKTKAVASPEESQEKEKREKEAKLASAKAHVKMLLAVMEAEKGDDTNLPELEDLEGLLNSFLNGDISAEALGDQILDNVKTIAKNKKNFLKSAKAQQKMEVALKQLDNSDDMWDDPVFKPVLSYVRNTLKEEKRKRDEKAVSKLKVKEGKDGWAIYDNEEDPLKEKKEKHEKFKKELEDEGWVIEEKDEPVKEDAETEKKEEVLVLKRDNNQF